MHNVMIIYINSMFDAAAQHNIGCLSGTIAISACIVQCSAAAGIETDVIIGYCAFLRLQKREVLYLPKTFSGVYYIR